MLILIGQLWAFMCTQLLPTLTGVLQNTMEILVWFSSNQCTHMQFSVVQIETLAMQTSFLIKMASGAVAKASLFCQLQSWLYRLLRSCLRNVGSGWRHKAPPNSGLEHASAPDTRGGLVKGQCRGSLQSWAWKKSKKLLFKYLCLGEIKTLPAIYVLQTMPLGI